MKTITNTILLLTVLVALWGCQKDPLAEVNEGAWNKERNIIDITFNGQIGEATVTRDGDNATIDFKYNTDAGALSAIEITAMEISWGASASASVGETLNFDNAASSATITVTAANGEPLEWVITLSPFTETLIGTWNVTELYVYGGTGPEYGGSALVKMIAKSWCWDATTGPEAERDNTLTFTLTGFTEDGNSYGTIVNDAGSDGLYADFIYKPASDNVDVNGFYRKIPAGTGSWLRNYSTDKVIFTFADGTTTSGVFKSAGEETIYGSIVKTVTDHSFMFTLSGVDNWSAIYTDYDKFVSRPRNYWIDITKSK